MMLPKFSEMKSEDAYMFISEFEEICAMMIQQLSDDVVKLRFIPFSLRDHQEVALQPGNQLYFNMGRVRYSLSKEVSPDAQDCKNPKPDQSVLPIGQGTLLEISK